MARVTKAAEVVVLKTYVPPLCVSFSQAASAAVVGRWWVGGAHVSYGSPNNVSYTGTRMAVVVVY